MTEPGFLMLFEKNLLLYTRRMGKAKFYSMYLKEAKKLSRNINGS